MLAERYGPSLPRAALISTIGLIPAWAVPAQGENAWWSAQGFRPGLRARFRGEKRGIKAEEHYEDNLCVSDSIISCRPKRTEAQWSGWDSGTTSSLLGVYLLDSGVGYSVGDSGTILKSTDAGMTWNALTSGTTRALYDVYFFNDAVGMAVGDGGLILRTTDGGANWSTVASGVRDGLRSVSFSDANGICGGLSQDILYSSDSGASWHVSQEGFVGGGFF